MVLTKRVILPFTSSLCHALAFKSVAAVTVLAAIVGVFVTVLASPPKFYS
jgi:hypothetical protein